MTNEQAGTVILKDQAGEYYLLPREMLARCRVSSEHRADVERLLTNAGSEDVSGHFLSFLAEMFAIHTGAAVAVSADVPVLVLPTSENR